MRKTPSLFLPLGKGEKWDAFGDFFFFHFS